MEHTIDIPCTARELESALHAICDNDGLDAKIIVGYKTCITGVSTPVLRIKQTGEQK
jgi:hypothetical protein